MAESSGRTVLFGVPTSWAELLATSLPGGVEPTTEALAGPIAGAVIAAVETCPATSLDGALASLEATVAANAIGPIRFLAQLLPLLLSQRAGRLVLVTHDVASLRSPEMAGARASAQAIWAYAESLRPALRGRGISLSMLALDGDDLTSFPSAAEIAAAITAEYRLDGLQRTVRIGKASHR